MDWRNTFNQLLSNCWRVCWLKKTLKPRGFKGKFVEYSNNSKAYKVWVPSVIKIIVARDAKFLHEFGVKNRNEEIIDKGEFNKTETDENMDCIWIILNILLLKIPREKLLIVQEILKSLIMLNMKKSFKRCVGRPRKISTES